MVSCTTRLVLIRSLLALVALASGCASDPPSVSTTTLTGERGDVYFHCGGYVTSTQLRLSQDPTGQRSESDYWIGGGRWDALARFAGDTLEVYSDWQFNEPATPSLPYVLVYRDLDASTFDVHPAQLYQDPEQAGLTNVSC